jgi:hypothetical protein
MTIPKFTAQFALKSAPRLRGYYQTFKNSIVKGVQAMEQPEVTSQVEAKPQDTNQGQVLMASTIDVQQPVLIPQQAYPVHAQRAVQSTEEISYPFVYAVGRIDPRFPSLSVEKEYAQAIGRAQTINLTDRQVLYPILSKRENRYLVRQLCWVFSIGDMETYILQPRDPADLDLYIEAINPQRPVDDRIDVLIGIRGPIASPEMCNGLMVPIVAFDQIYSFTRDVFISAVPRPQTIPQDQDAQFRAAIEEVFDRIIQIADNAGATNEHRALNYLAMREPAIYVRAAESYQQNESLTEVDVRTSALRSTQMVMDVIFSYTHRQTGVVDKYSVSVDVSGEFPFLVRPLSPFYER